jgi:hypothetical protein
VAWIIGEVRVRSARYCINDPTIQTTFSLLTPYAAYLAAEALHVSGILSVVAAGIYAGIHDTRHLDTPTRTHSNEVWTMLLFAFNGLVFLLLGVQLRSVLIRLEGATWLQLAGYAFALVAALIIVRILWVFPAAYLPRYFSQEIRTREPALNPRAVFLVGWAGIRGSVTMAAALSIPFTLENGAPFPGRDLVIFLAGATIVLTLVLNALTLPLLIRVFGLRGDGNAEREERAARIATAQAAIDDGAARLNGYLEDYAYMLEGLLALYEATFDIRWFEDARNLADTMIDQFEDEEKGGFFFTGKGHETLIARNKDGTRLVITGNHDDPNIVVAIGRSAGDTLRSFSEAVGAPLPPPAGAGLPVIRALPVPPERP